jgi:hypothetical protein
LFYKDLYLYQNPPSKALSEYQHTQTHHSSLIAHHSHMYPRIFAFLLTIGFFGLIWLYMREFPLLSNTLGAGWLALGSILVGFAVAAGALWYFRERFMPWDRHRPDVAFLLATSMFFSPLLGSWLNRGLGNKAFQSFKFISETPFVATGYGILKDEKIKPTGYHLLVSENGTLRKFKYKTQSYYPVTKPGEDIMLPICKGFFGARVMLLN